MASLRYAVLTSSSVAVRDTSSTSKKSAIGSVEQLGQQLGGVIHQRDHLLVRHARRPDDTDHARQRPCVVFRGHDGEIPEAFIFVLGADRYRDPGSLTTPPQ